MNDPWMRLLVLAAVAIAAVMFFYWVSFALADWLCSWLGRICVT